VDVTVYKDAKNKERLDAFKEKGEMKDSRVVVVGDGGWRSRVDVRFEIMVPKKFSLDLETNGGSISAKALQSKVKAETSGGSIAVGDIDGYVGLDAAGGKEVKAETAGGSINVGDSQGDVYLEPAGGSIKVGSTQGQVKAETAG
jgi:hypothetical protein